jgi:hypothetical protein
MTHKSENQIIAKVPHAMARIAVSFVLQFLLWSLLKANPHPSFAIGLALGAVLQSVSYGYVNKERLNHPGPLHCVPDSAYYPALHPWPARRLTILRVESPPGLSPSGPALSLISHNPIRAGHRTLASIRLKTDNPLRREA